jgi:hypothetical protein
MNSPALDPQNRQTRRSANPAIRAIHGKKVTMERILSVTGP